MPSQFRFLCLCVGLTACELDSDSDPEPEKDNDDPAESTPEVGEPDEVEPGVENGKPTASARSELDCSAKVESHSSTACAFQELKCGDTVTARIGSGSSRFSDDFYLDKHCGIYQNGYSGADSVYALKLPANTRARVSLETPCAPLHLASVKWNDPQKCPSTQHMVGPCEMDQRNAQPQITITTIRPETDLVIVDGVGGADGVYRLTVACDDYR